MKKLLLLLFLFSCKPDPLCESVLSVKNTTPDQYEITIDPVTFTVNPRSTSMIDNLEPGKYWLVKTNLTTKESEIIENVELTPCDTIFLLIQ